MLETIVKAAESIGTGMVKPPITPSGPTSGITTSTKSDFVFFQLKPFTDNELSVEHRKTVLRSCMSFKGKVVFAITGNAQKIRMYIGLPARYQRFFTNIFYGTFGTSELEPAPEYHIFQHKKHLKFTFGSVLADKDAFVHGGAYMDPLKDMFSLFHGVDEQSQLSVYLTLNLSKSFRDRIWNTAKKVSAFGKAKQEDEQEDKSQEKQKNQAAIYDKQLIKTDLSFSIKCKDTYSKSRIEQNVTAFFHTFVLTGKFSLKNKPVYTPMHPDQLINFFHLPTKDYFIKGLEYNVYRKLPYPSNLPREGVTPADDLTILGKTDYRADAAQFGIKKEDKFRHMYVVGKTGTGKSTFLSNLIKSDMEAGNGLCLLDPHGDLVETCLEHVPNHRINDVILFDISDDDFPVGFNLLQRNTPDEKNRIVSGVVSVFKKMFAHSWGPRLEYVLRNVLLSLVDYPNATLMHLLRILTDKNFKEEVMGFVKDPMLLKFRNEEFNKRNDKQLQETIGPITNKVGQFLSSPVVRNIFGQYRSKLNLRKAMDEGKILLVNLSKGKIGEDNASMVGALLVTKFQIEAMARANVAYHERRDFYLYIDEFQNFATDSFATILSEARKYKLSLIVANQYTSQLDENVRDAIFGNVGTMISFTLGYDDAAAIMQQYKQMVSTNDLISLPRFTAYTRLMIDGITSNPFSMKTNPLPSLEHGVAHIAKIKEQSRQRYAIPRSELERYMADRYNKNFSAQEKVMEKAMLASIGVPESEIEVYQSQAITVRLNYFTDYALQNIQPDAILFDLQEGSHKAIFTHQVQANPHMTNEKGDPLEVWVISLPDALRYIQAHYNDTTRRKFVRNIEKLKASAQQASTPTPPPMVQQQEAKGGEAPAPQASVPQSSGLEVFSIDDIILGKKYEGYIKLKYNYGLFITVKGVEGLCHKDNTVAPEGQARKKYFNIGDKITVTAERFAEVKGEKKVVWTMKP